MPRQYPQQRSTNASMILHDYSGRLESDLYAGRARLVWTDDHLIGRFAVSFGLVQV